MRKGKQMTSKRKPVKKSRRARRRARRAFFLCLVIFGLLALLTRLLVFVPVKMETNAMQPVYQRNDVVLADRLTLLRGDAISRGEDVYAYFAAANGCYVRRVVGMPGDLIDVRDGQRFLVYDGGTKEIALGEAPGLVYGELPEGAYLLLASDLSAEGVADGRTLGLVYETDIRAKAGVILWPVNRMFRGR